LTGGEFISKLFTFASFVFLARVLGPENFGHLEFMLAVMIFFTLLVDFGSSPYGAREVAKDHSKIKEVLANISILRGLFAVIGYILLTALALLLPPEKLPVEKVILIFGISLFGIPFFLQWVFQGLDRMKVVALGSIIRYMLFAAGVFLLIRTPEDLWLVAVVECLAVSGFVLYYLLMYRLKIGELNFKTNSASIVHSIRQYAPIGLSEVTWAMTWYSATVLLALMVGGKTVGWFSASHRPIMTLHAFIWLYFYNMLPTISRCSRRPQEELQSFMAHSMKLSGWTAVFIGASGMMLAEPMIRLFFGIQYIESITTFKILLWVLPVALLSGHYRYVLIAYSQQRYEFIASAIAAGVSILMGIVLIPLFSAYGAAAALLGSSIINWMIAYFYVQKKITEIPFSSHLVKPLMAAAAMFTGFLLLQPVDIWLARVAGILIFGSLLFILQPEAKRIIAQFSSR